MFQAEYVRNLNCNYERILLDKKPEENRYQYCIIGRGGIKGLLSCSLRYLNGLAYLYYDISSTQNVAQLYNNRSITREWMKDFFWSMRQIRQEMDRFLLDQHNIIWNPDQIYQDVEKNIFYFLYIPYYEGDCGFLSLVDYWVEHINYEDEGLVECVYKMHEQYELLGEVYLQEQIFEDFDSLNEMKQIQESLTQTNVREADALSVGDISVEETKETNLCSVPSKESGEEKTQKKGFRYLFESRMKKQKEERAEYLHSMQDRMNGYAVCEDTEYQAEDLGKTIFIEEGEEQKQETRGLYNQKGERVARLETSVYVIGKKPEEADCVLKDNSVSRVHARILSEDGRMYLEDLNSTNGTYKNGLRLQPYEKRILEPEDEIRLGKIILIFK